MFDLFSSISESANKNIVEVMYYSLIDYRDNKKERTVTNNGGPQSGRDFMNTELTEIAESNGFTWSLRKIFIYEYIILHHSETNVIYVLASENSLYKAREELADRKKPYYLEAWAFTNDKWSGTSVKDQVGQVTADFEGSEQFVIEKYELLREMNKALLLEHTAELCVFITFKTKNYSISKVSAIIPSSNLENDFLYTEDWSHYIPVLYYGDTIQDDGTTKDEFDLQLKDGILDEQVDLNVDIDQDDIDSETES